MNAQSDLGGRFTLPGGALSLKRMGYGAMRLSLKGTRWRFAMSGVAPIKGSFRARSQQAGVCHSLAAPRSAWLAARSPSNGPISTRWA